MLLRMVSDKRHWESAADYPWLPADKGPAAILKDQYLDSASALSVYEIPSGDAALVKRVVVAFAAGGQHRDKRDYVLFENDIAEDVGLRIVPTLGHTADATANTLHRDLVQVTCSQVGALFDLAYRRGQIGRVDSWDVERGISDGIMAGYINKNAIHKDWLKRLG